MTKNPVLTYFDDGIAYFSPSIEDEWGDDWNDAPYEHNAGEPYHQVCTLLIRGDYKTPRCGHYNSPWSVQQINQQKIPWVTAMDMDAVMGVILPGTGLREFIDQAKNAGLQVFYSDEANECLRGF